MVKTLRISEENHKNVLKIQGQIQAQTGEYTFKYLIWKKTMLDRVRTSTGLNLVGI